MNKIKALFFDIDHTLFSHTQHRIPEDTWNALQYLRGKGMKLFIATGRHPVEMEKLDVDWSFFDGFATLNGTLNLDADGSVLSSYPIEGRARESIRRLFESREYAFLVVEKERIYANRVNELAHKAQLAIGLPLPHLEAMDDGEIYQLVFYEGPELEGRIMSQLDYCTASRWNDYAFDVIRSGCGKDKGVATLLAHHGLGSDECIVFGDGDNDVPMFLSYPNSVAMENGSQSCRDNAAFITKHIDEGGIVHALKHYGVL